MREIKFRAWDAVVQTMMFPTNISWNQSGITSMCFQHGVPPDDDGNITLPSIIRDGFPIMQYTGLADKNGKEIYEGDVVCYVEDVIVETIEGHHRYEPEGRIGSIEFDKGSFYVNNDEGDLYSHGEQLFAWDELEIIGNIYENPELLTD